MLRTGVRVGQCDHFQNILMNLCWLLFVVYEKAIYIYDIFWSFGRTGTCYEIWFLGSFCCIPLHYLDKGLCWRKGGHVMFGRCWTIFRPELCPCIIGRTDRVDTSSSCGARLRCSIRCKFEPWQRTASCRQGYLASTALCDHQTSCPIQQRRKWLCFYASLHYESPDRFN